MIWSCFKNISIWTKLLNNNFCIISLFYREKSELFLRLYFYIFYNYNIINHHIQKNSSEINHFFSQCWSDKVWKNMRTLSLLFNLRERSTATNFAVWGNIWNLMRYYFWFLESEEQIIKCDIEDHLPSKRKKACRIAARQRVSGGSATGFDFWRRKIEWSNR